MAEQQKNPEKGHGQAEYTPVQAGSIKKGGYCMIKGFPCLVTDFSTTKTNKGGVKASIVGTDIFTNKKYEESCPISSTVQVPTLLHTEYEVADVDEDGFVSVQLHDGSLKSNLKLPQDDKELSQSLKQCWDDNNAKGTVFFTILSAGGFQKFVSHRFTLDTEENS